MPNHGFLLGVDIMCTKGSAINIYTLNFYSYVSGMSKLRTWFVNSITIWELEIGDGWWPRTTKKHRFI
jgi:hypothetical protein